MEPKATQNNRSIKGLILLFIFSPIFSLAQVGIGTTSPNSSAKLQVDADPSSLQRLHRVYSCIIWPRPVRHLIMLLRGIISMMDRNGSGSQISNLTTS